MSRWGVSLLALTLASVQAWAGPFAANGTPANSPAFVGFATGVSTLTRGPQSLANPAGPLASFGSAASVLGAPDASLTGVWHGDPVPQKVVSLGDGGSITLTFAHAIVNGSGADFAVFENGFVFSAGVYAELAFVEVSANGTDFVRFPSTSLTQTTTPLGTFGAIDPTNIHNLAGQFPAMEGTPFDLADVGLNSVTHVRLVDVVGALDQAFRRLDSNGNPINDPWQTTGIGSGFDLDAVGVIHQAPEPSSLVLLALGGAVVGLRRWRVRPVLTAFMLGLICTLPAVAEDAIKKDLKQLQGTWLVTAAEKDGQAFERIKGGKLTVKDSNFTIVTAGGVELKGDLRLDPAKQPRSADLAHQEGLLRDKTWEGIYDLDGDDLKLCYAEADSGKPRPTEFKTEADSGLLLVIMKREKK